MDPRWFREDRKLPREEREEAITESKKALANSTLLIRRLTDILEDEISKTYTSEEDYTNVAWERNVLAMFARRKTLKEIIKLLP